MSVHWKEIGDVLGEIIHQVGKDESIKKTILGTYSDGTPRSVVDAYRDELLSPEDRTMMEERMKEIRKNRKKRAKQKNKKKKKKRKDPFRHIDY